jgi:membrane fusion protein, macrolide-specific efflux system
MGIIKTISRKLSQLIQWFIKAPLTLKLIIIIVLGLILWQGVPRILNANKSAPQYQTAQVERGTLITNVSGSGTVLVGNSVAITTQATGVVTNVYVNTGDTVTQGEKIADITLDLPSQQRQQAANSNLLAAQNNLNSAQAKVYSLQSALFKANQAFITDKGIQNPSDQDKSDPKYIEEHADWLQAEADYKNQAGVISQAQSSLSSASLAYQQASPTITAPADGVITNLTVNEGLPITSSTNASGSNTSASTQSVGTITIEGGQLEANISLSEIDVTKVKVGQKATMTLDAFPDKTFTGHVASINTTGTVSSNVTSYPATIVFDSNNSNIYSNMAVDAKIITSVKDNVLLVPSTAIQTSNGTTTVRVLKNGQVQTVTVEVGSSNDTQTEITSGLNEGDTVVTGTIGGTSRTGATSSPFGGTGFGGIRTFGGFGGGAGGARGR